MQFPTEINLEGQLQIDTLIKEKECGAFNEWEKTFIQDLVGKRYEKLSKKERLIVIRLIGWLGGFGLGVH